MVTKEEKEQAIKTIKQWVEENDDDRGLFLCVGEVNRQEENLSVSTALVGVRTNVMALLHSMLEEDEDAEDVAGNVIMQRIKDRMAEHEYENPSPSGNFFSCN